MHFDGFDYQGEIENISLGGALVRLDSEIPSCVRPGSTCALRLWGKQQEANPVGYTCRVVRFDSASVGVQILELNYGETVH